MLWYPFCGLAAHAWDRKVPPQSVRSIATPGAVDQAELRLEAVPPHRQGNGYGKVSLILARSVRSPHHNLLVPHLVGAAIRQPKVQNMH